MRNYIAIFIILLKITEGYINIPQFSQLTRVNKIMTLNVNDKKMLDDNQKFIYKNYLLSIRKVKKTIKRSNSVIDINNIIDNVGNIINTSQNITNNKSVLYLKQNNTVIDNDELIAKKLILSNIHIDVSNVKHIQISTKNDTLIIDLDKNNDVLKSELNKIDTFLNVASILTSLMNN
jgi:hypothetical protein